MTTVKQSDDGLPDNLPLLTEVVAAGVPDDLPTLTEVVADTEGGHGISSSPASRKLPASSGNENIRVIPESATPAVRENKIDTMETEIAGKEISPSGAAVPPPRVLSEAELQQILHHIEAHIETIFASKLSLHFEQLRDALNTHLDSRL